MTIKLRILLCVLLLALAVVAGVSAEAFNPTTEGADTPAHAPAWNSSGTNHRADVRRLTSVGG